MNANPIAAAEAALDRRANQPAETAEKWAARLAPLLYADACAEDAMTVTVSTYATTTVDIGGRQLRRSYPGSAAWPDREAAIGAEARLVLREATGH